MKTKRKIDYDMPIGKLVRIPDFLPLPEQLEIEEESSDPWLLKTIAEGRRAIRKGARDIVIKFCQKA
jgi:hypothetical protein